MRLNRRKNRDSQDRRKGPLEREQKQAAKAPPGEGDDPRQELARAVRSVRSSGPQERRERRRERSQRRGERPEGPKRRRLGRLKADARRRVRLTAGRRRRGDGGRSDRRDALLAGARSVAVDVVGVGREILRWPARIWMAVAERLGAAVLAAWRRAALPALRLAGRWMRVAMAWAERVVTPARGLAVVAVAATLAVGGSQFGDYRAVEVGTPAYAHVENVAPAPQVQSAMPRSAHGIWVFAIAVVSLFVILFAVWRNWRLARLLLFGGVAVVAISLFVDRPEGLRLGTAGEAYSGAHAVLLGAFWVQLFAGATLAVVGPLLALQLRGERSARRRQVGGRHENKPRPKRAPRLRPGVGT
jgi:hypothetical protein